MHRTKVISAKNKKYVAFEKLCIVNTPEHVKVSKDILVYNGQGEGETK